MIHRLYQSAICDLSNIYNSATYSSKEKHEVIDVLDYIIASTDNEDILDLCISVLSDIGDKNSLELVKKYNEKFSQDELRYYIFHNPSIKINAITKKSSVQSSSGTAMASSGSSMSHYGMAVYRDGTLHGYEWHAGLCAISTAPNNTSKSIIHIPGRNKTVCYTSKKAFVGSNKYKGEYYRKGVAQSKYKNAYITAKTLLNKGVGYTFTPVIKYGAATNGKYKPSSVKKVRCDALVEYCLEYNGVRVYGPNDSAQTWNIATPLGKDEHSSFGFSPKIQASCLSKR